MSSVFHDLMSDRPELLRTLARIGIADRELSPVVTPLTGGVSSNIVRIQIGDRNFCLKQALPKLKAEKDWQVPVDRVYAEIDWLRTAERLVPGHAPRVIGVDKQTNSFVMEFLPDSYRNWKSELMAGRIAPETAARLGEVLGRIHAGTAGDSDMADLFANDDLFYAIRLEPYLEEAARQHPAVAGVLSALIERTRLTRKALVHGDVSPKNILVGLQGPVLLDAECACYGDPAFDVAFFLNHLLLKSAWRLQLLPELLQCLELFVARYSEQVDWEPLDDLIMRIQTLLPGLLLARIDGKSPVEYLSEATREHVRRLALDMLGAPSISLFEITRLWKKEFVK